MSTFAFVAFSSGSDASDASEADSAKDRADKRGENEKQKRKKGQGQNDLGGAVGVEDGPETTESDSVDDVLRRVDEILGAQVFADGPEGSKGHRKGKKGREKGKGEIGQGWEDWEAHRAAKGKSKGKMGKNKSKGRNDDIMSAAHDAIDEMIIAAELEAARELGWI